MKRIVFFLLNWLIVMPAFALAAAAPDMSVVQREKETQLVFSWNEPVDFSEKTENGEYRLSFKTQIAGEFGTPDQIQAALPSKWRKIRFSKRKYGFDVIVSLPVKGAARAQKKGNVVWLSLFEKEKPDVRNVKKTVKAKPAAVRKKAEPAEEKLNTPASVPVKPEKDSPQ